jgi:RNA polymerase sigma factor (sigma-70 family)
MSREYTLTREVLEQHHEQAFKWAMSCCDYDYERAREVIQIVYIEILEEKAVFHEKSSLRTWLFSVIRHLAWQHTRRIKSGEKFVARLARYIELDKNNRDESDIQIQDDRKCQVWNAIKKLSNGQRQIIELVYYRDFTLAETAEILGVSLGSVSTQFHRAKKQLAKQLAQLQD